MIHSLSIMRRARNETELYKREIIIFSFVPFELKTKLKNYFYLEFDPSSG